MSSNRVFGVWINPTLQNKPEPASQKHLCIIRFDLAGGGGDEEVPEGTKNLTLPGTESTKNPLATEHIAASKTCEAPAFGAKKKKRKVFLMTALLQLFSRQQSSSCSQITAASPQGKLKVESIMYSATHSLL